MSLWPQHYSRHLVAAMRYGRSWLQLQMNFSCLTWKCPRLECIFLGQDDISGSMTRRHGELLKCFCKTFFWIRPVDAALTEVHPAVTYHTASTFAVWHSCFSPATKRKERGRKSWGGGGAFPRRPVSDLLPEHELSEWLHGDAARVASRASEHSHSETDKNWTGTGKRAAAWNISCRCVPANG